jgi:osmotically-inducible protein OsmY
MRKSIKYLTIALIAMVLVGCTGSSTSESTGEYLDSSAVTAKVKGRLVDILGAKAAMSIKVKTYKGSVQLSGFVNNESIKQRAGVVADDTIGVNDVRNNLIVK